MMPHTKSICQRTLNSIYVGCTVRPQRPEPPPYFLMQFKHGLGLAVVYKRLCTVNRRYSSRFVPIYWLARSSAVTFLFRPIGYAGLTSKGSVTGKPAKPML